MAFLGALVAMHWDLGALIGNIGTGPEIMLGSKKPSGFVLDTLYASLFTEQLKFIVRQMGRKQFTSQ